MDQREKINQAMQILHDWLCELGTCAEMDPEYLEALWIRLSKSVGVLREFAYYHDYRKFLCEYKVDAYTLADILVWQVDHFKAYLDRPEEMNRYKQERLLLDSIDIMLRMEENPKYYIDKIQCETGTDFEGKY